MKSAIELAEKLYPYLPVEQGDYSTEQKYIKNRGKIDRYRKAFINGYNRCAAIQSPTILPEDKLKILTMLTSFVQDNRMDYAEQIYEIIEHHFKAGKNSGLTQIEGTNVLRCETCGNLTTLK